MCLIQIKLTPKASENGHMTFLYGSYGRFFARSTIASMQMAGDNLVGKIYVHFPENYVSNFINSVLQHDTKIEEVIIVS